MRATHRRPVTWGLLAFHATSAVAQLPYNPARILQQTSDSTVRYVFRPATSSSSTQFRLDTLDTSSGSTNYTSLFDTLPFLSDTTSIPFTPVIDRYGNITVYTGECGEAADGNVWRYTPSEDADEKNSWVQESVSIAEDADGTSMAGATYLSQGWPFSSDVEGNTTTTTLYFFGGMCPYGSGNDTQSAANYSNMMLTMDPAAGSGYTLGISDSRGPPVAEAGFTLTPLLPTYTNESDGTETQQQDAVLIGGHTAQAFINMSQVAIFSLPQQGWTFVSVEQPAAEQSELAVRSAVTSVDPRSGHTAVLTSDGTKIVVFGGWVGDVDTPASPQLAIMHIGEAYGGEGEWRWTAPSTTGKYLSDGNGIYGHAAAMLPGDVMMIAGGYEISASSSSRLRRRSATASTDTLFLNITSGSWVEEYVVPSSSTSSSSSSGSSGPLSKTSQKAGLAVGLTVGCSAVVGLLFFYFWYKKRLEVQRDEREKQLAALTYSTHRFTESNVSGLLRSQSQHSSFSDGFVQQTWNRVQEAERSGYHVENPSPTRGLRRPARGAYQLAPGAGGIHPIDEREEYDEKAGTSAPLLDPFRDPASPHSNPRHSNPFSDPYRQPSDPSSPAESRNLEMRGWQHDWQKAADALLNHDLIRGAGGRLSPSKLSSNLSSGPSSNYSASLAGTATVPSSDRTDSNLSERSYITASSSAKSGNSSVTAFLNSLAYYKENRVPSPNPVSANPSGYTSTSSLTPWEAAATARRNHPSISSAATTSAGPATSTSTARRTLSPDRLFLPAPHATAPGFDVLQFEQHDHFVNGAAPTPASSGMHIIPRRPVRPSAHRAHPSTSTIGTAISTPGNVAAPAPRGPPTTGTARTGFLGSVRRALSRSVSGAAGKATAYGFGTGWLGRVSPGDRKDASSAAAATAYQPLLPASSAAIAAIAASSAKAASPRRAVSDASFLRERRGKRDWTHDDDDPMRMLLDPHGRHGRPRSGDDWGVPSPSASASASASCATEKERERHGLLAADEAEDGGEAEWDVERAAEDRVVQVLFTVPRQRLRVVNAEVSSVRSSEAGSRKVSGASTAGVVGVVAGGVERVGSGRSAGSVRSVRSRESRGKGGRVVSV